MANTNNAENAKLMYEAGQNFTDFTAMTDSGDNTTFTSSAALWSGKSGYEPDVRPNGVITGGGVTPGSASDTVDVAALTCYLAGVNTSVSASSGEAVTRAATDTHLVNSITVTSAGAIAVLQGSEGTSFSETRGANGGPPWIPTDSIEIGQVRLSAQATAAVTTDEIKQVVGTHLERFDLPVWEEDNYEAEVTFISALPTIHSDDSGTTTAAKAVYVKYYEPSFAEVPYSSDFVPPENSHSVNSTQVYGSTVASTSTSLNQGSFNAMLKDGITDNLLAEADETLWFKFLPDRNKTPYLLAQGKLGITRNFPAGDNINVSATISATAKAQGISS